MSEEKRKLGNYEAANSIYIGDKEVVFGVDKSDKYPFLVSYCDYHNPFGVPWATESVGCDDYLEAMGIFIQRVQSQIEQTKSELSKFAFDNTVFTKDHCIPDKRSSSIVGKVVVINAEPKRYEYQHPAFQLVLAHCRKNYGKPFHCLFAYIHKFTSEKIDCQNTIVSLSSVTPVTFSNTEKQSFTLALPLYDVTMSAYIFS